MGIESDDTVRLRVPRRGRRAAKIWPWLGGALLGAVLASGGAWWSRRPGPAAPVLQAPLQAPAELPGPASQIAPPQAAAFAPPSEKPGYDRLSTAPRAPAPVYAPRLASEAEILADQPETLAVYRFAPLPAIVVLQFPSLAEQALMLNRVAALVEKSGFPHEQVMSRPELNAKIIAGGSNPDEFYYGHDYRSADLVRFFTLAQDLDTQEQGLQTLVHDLGWTERDAVGALVTLVRQSAGAGLDASARTAILRHELSHGVYFTNTDYAAYCGHFWRDVLTPDERARFVAFLGREGYDTALPDLMINETQAYLMHTPDRRFFNPAEVGIPQTRIAELRQVFLVGMPPGWLRDATSTDKLP